MFGISEPERHTASLSSLAPRLTPPLLTQLYSNMTNLNFRFIRVRSLMLRLDCSFNRDKLPGGSHRSFQEIQHTTIAIGYPVSLYPQRVICHKKS